MDRWNKHGLCVPYYINPPYSNHNVQLKKIFKHKKGYNRANTNTFMFYALAVFLFLNVIKARFAIY